MPHSGHNLLLMWSRLVSSMTYMKTDIPTLLDSLTPRVMEAYVNSMLNDIDEDGTDEDGTTLPPPAGHSCTFTAEQHQQHQQILSATSSPFKRSWRLSRTWGAATTRRPAATSFRCSIRVPRRIR